MDPVVAIIGMLATAVSVLFGAYTLAQKAAYGRVEKENEILRAQNAALERENKEYVAVLVLLHSGEQTEVERVRETVARILRGEKGYGGGYGGHGP